MLAKISTCALLLFSSSAFAFHAADLLEEFENTPDRSPASALVTPIDWAQPPVGCVEEIIPNVPDRGCLDLTRVNDPLKDFPANLSPEDQEYWRLNKRPLLYCRATEVLRREALRPGSFSTGAIELAWMQNNAVRLRSVKLAAVYEASQENKMPAQVLTGALYQESLFSELGIAEDGNNFSCGLGQINILEWCRWADKQKGARRRGIGLGKAPLDCAQLETTLVKPFYEIAKTRLHGLPEYRLQKEHFQNIAFEEVVSDFPPASNAVQRMRYDAVRAFVTSCQDPRNGIAAKANELASLYARFIPAGLKQKDQYKPEEKFGRSCQAGYDRAYPLHMGWLLAVGSYNAGPKAVDALAHYNKWTRADLEKVATFKHFSPADMIDSLYWTGKYNELTDKIDVTNLNGSIQNWQWFKTCVLQRHVARVIQHVTLPGVPNFVDSLEGKYPCAKSVFDETGKLVKSGVPLFRQKSSGVKKEARRI